MKIYDFEQYSEAWYQIRIGKPTSSGFDNIITPTGKPSTQAKKYMYQLAGEAILGKCEETYQSEAMLRGKELEAEARKYYEFLKNTEVKQIGFCVHDTINCGASPDGLVEKGGLEIKCPKLSTHIEYLINNELPNKYFVQTQGQMFVAGLKWVDFFSYYPGIKPLMIRVEPDKDFQNKLKEELITFCDRLKDLINKLKEV